MAAAMPGGRAVLLRAAAQDAGRIEREKVAWGEPLAQLLHAGVAAVRGDRTAALDRLGRAAAGFDAAHMGLFAAAARRRHGEILSGPDGLALVTSADDALRRQQVRAPERLAAAFAPWRLAAAQPLPRVQHHQGSA
jgi:hypothetical protein